MRNWTIITRPVASAVASAIAEDIEHACPNSEGDWHEHLDDAAHDAPEICGLMHCDWPALTEALAQLECLEQREAALTEALDELRRDWRRAAHIDLDEAQLVEVHAWPNVPATAFEEGQPLEGFDGEDHGWPRAGRARALVEAYGLDFDPDADLFGLSEEEVFLKTSSGRWALTGPSVSGAPYVVEVL